MKRFAILLAGIMLAAAGLIAAPATALADGELEVSVTADKETACLGDEITFTVTVTNVCPHTVTNLSIDTNAGQQLVGVPVRLAPGESFTGQLICVVDQAHLISGKAHLVASAKAGISGSDNATGSSQCIVNIVPSPLAVEITTSSVTLTPDNEPFEIGFTVTNNSLYDNLSYGVQCSLSSGALQATADYLENGESLDDVLTFQAGAEEVLQGSTTAVVAVLRNGVEVARAEKVITVSVSPKISLSDCSITWSGTDDVVYDGKAHSPKATIAFTFGALSGSFTASDYTFKRGGADVPEAKDAGTYTAIVTGTGNFMGTAAQGFTITPRPMIDEGISIEVPSSVEYAGSPVTPAVTVKFGETALKEGTDYTLEYDNNNGPGTGKVIVKGKGNFQGDVTKTFTINAPAPTYSLSVVFEFDPPVTACQFGDKITGTATVTNTGTSVVRYDLTCGLVGMLSSFSYLVDGTSKSFTFEYIVTYADVEAGMITTAGSVSAVGPDGEEIPVTITITDATAKVVPTPTVFTIDLGEGTLDGKTGKVTIDANVGQPYPLPTGTPVYAGHTFVCYRGSEYYPGDTYIVEADHTLTAVYKKNQPTIPDTGDATPIALALALLVVSGAGLAFARKRG